MQKCRLYKQEIRDEKGASYQLTFKIGMRKITAETPFGLGVKCAKEGIRVPSKSQVEKRVDENKGEIPIQNIAFILTQMRGGYNSESQD